MFVLENLWKGRIRPSERCYRDGSRYAELISKGAELEKRVRDELSESGKNAYKELYETQVEMIEIGEQDAFIQGVRLGRNSCWTCSGNIHLNSHRWGRRAWLTALRKKG